MCPADASLEAWKIFLEIQRCLSPAEKLRRTIQLSERVRRAAEPGLREECPQADVREIFLRLIRLRLGPELFEKVYGPVIPSG
jgi:hypothetical protein